MNRRGAAWAAVAVTAAVLLAGPAYAAWSVAGNAAGTGSAATLQAPASASTTGVTSSSITVQWSAPGGGPAPTAYRVERVTPAAVICPSTTALTCTDSGLSASTSYSYRVYALLHSWDGSAAQTSGATAAAADTTAPVVTPGCPTSGGSYTKKRTGQNASLGTWISDCGEQIRVAVSDASGVAGVKISVRAGTSGDYLQDNGNWNSATEQKLTASPGTTAGIWYIAVPENKVAPGTKTVTVYATDSSAAANVTTTEYTFDITS